MEDREDLNGKVHDLCERARELKSHQVLRTQLQDECAELRTAIRKLRGACSQLPALPATPGKDSLLSLLLRQRQLQAEIEVWRRHQDEERDVEMRKGAGPIQAKMRVCLCVRLHTGVCMRVCLQLEMSLEQLKECLKVVKLDRAAAKRDLKREKRLLEETLAIQTALREKVAQAEGELNKEKHSSKSSHQTWLEEQLERYQSHSDTLRGELESFVEDHLNLENGGEEAKKRSKGSLTQTTLKQSEAAGAKQTTLTQFIQALVEKTLSSPHHPYISTSRLNPDYFLLLLRSGVIQRHPDNSSLVKMTPFHH